MGFSRCPGVVVFKSFHFLDHPGKFNFGPCGRSLAELLVKVFGEGSTHPMMLCLGSSIMHPSSR